MNPNGNTAHQIQPQVLFEIENWAYSVNSVSIGCFSSFKLEKKTEPKAVWSPILFVGGVHGDEPEGVKLAEDLLQWLKSNTSKLQHHWVLIPCINPDGFRKNERTNANGVDLNRNFPCKNWSKEFSKERYFPGLEPNSEPETQTLVEIIEQISPKIIIHFHSWEPCVVYSGEKGRKAAKLFSESSSYELKETIGYDTPGSLGDYGNIDLDIPVVCLEASEGMPLDDVWPKFKMAFEKLMTEDSWIAK